MPRAAKNAKPDENGSHDSSQIVSAGKRAAAPARRRQQRGKLQDFLDMPLNVITEVFSHLEPLDLLHLARTTKMLRGMLMKRRNASLWKTARANVGLPDCPEDVPEPLYVNLVFCAYCHRCGKKQTGNIVWDMKVRWCKVCHREMKLASEWYFGIPTGPSVATILAPVKLEAQWNDCNMMAVCRIITSCENATFFHDEESRLVMHSEIQQLKALLAKMTLENRTQYLCWRVKTNEQWRRLIPSLKRFCEIRAFQQDTRRADMREARYNSIVQKLTELGWGNELRSMSISDFSELRKLPFVDEARRPLTDRAWKNGLPILNGFMNGIKATRLAQEKVEVLKARFTLLREVLKETYAGGEGQPSAFDIALSMPEVRAAINVPVEVQLDKTAFEFLQNTSALSEFATQWRKDQEAALTRIVERITDTLPPGADVLSLAVARFMCVRCETRLANLRVLSHCCLGDAFEGGLHVNGTTDVYRRAALRAFAQTPRSMPEHMVVADVEAMLLVLPIAGLYDVRRDVVKPPSEDPLRLACKACKPKRGVAVMTWASALRPEHLKHCRSRGLYVVPYTQADVAIELERRAMEKMRRDRLEKGESEDVEPPQEDVIPVVYVLSERMREETWDLSREMEAALANGRAAFFQFTPPPRDTPADSAPAQDSAGGAPVS